MPHETAPKIELSARVRKIIEEIARQRSTEYRLVIRASLILAMAAGAGNHELVRTQKLDRGTVRYWRGRWIELTPKLTRAEASAISDEDLRALVLTGLSDLQRSGMPPKFGSDAYLVKGMTGAINLWDEDSIGRCPSTKTGKDHPAIRCDHGGYEQQAS